MNSSAKDALRLKMAGLILIVVGLTGFGLTGDAMGDGSKSPNRPAGLYRTDAGAWLVAAHVAAFGLIVLLAGLKNVPLLTSANARRGAWQKLIGFTLIILCFAYAGVMDMPAFKFVAETWWIAFPSLVAFLVSAHVGFKLLRTGWKYDVVSAEQLLATDPRPPVVYLRSFEADSEIVMRPPGFWNRAMTVIFDYMMMFSPEQELEEILNRVGPVIAIGKPGEPLPELGAAQAIRERCGLEGQGYRHDRAVAPRGHTNGLHAQPAVGDRADDCPGAAPTDSVCEPRRRQKNCVLRPIF